MTHFCSKVLMEWNFLYNLTISLTFRSYGPRATMSPRVKGSCPFADSSHRKQRHKVTRWSNQIWNRKLHSIKALEPKWCHQHEHIFEAPTFSNASTMFEPAMNGSFWDMCFLKFAKFIWQLSPLNGNDVIKVDMHVCHLSHRIFLPSFSLICSTILEILSFSCFVRKWPWPKVVMRQVGIYNWSKPLFQISVKCVG